MPRGEQANSWLTGANIEGKHRGATVYFGGADKYFVLCEEIAREGYRGFEMRKSDTAVSSNPANVSD